MSTILFAKILNFIKFLCGSAAQVAQPLFGDVRQMISSEILNQQCFV